MITLRDEYTTTTQLLTTIKPNMAVPFTGRLQHGPVRYNEIIGRKNIAGTVHH